MSRYRHTYLYSFKPSVYSNGLHPLLPYNIHETEKTTGYEYGGPLDLVVSAYNLTHPDKDEKPSFLSQYWWVLLVAVPFIYVGVNMALDSVKPVQEKK